MNNIESCKEVSIVSEELKKEIRSVIYNIEEAISKSEEEGLEPFFGDTEKCPLTHSFSDGIYCREIKIPAGMVVTGKIHKHEHPNYLMSGEVLVLTEDGGSEVLKGPLSMMSKGGTKRALYAITDLVWTTIHHNPTNTRDLKEIEKIVIAKDYEEYKRFAEAPKKLHISVSRTSTITFIEKVIKWINKLIKKTL